VELDKLINEGSRKDTVIKGIADSKEISLNEMTSYIKSVEKSMSIDND